jgi:preprotein translocase subunit SecF
LIAILSIGFGVSAAVFAANNNRFPKVSDDEKHELFWIYAIAIGSFLFVLISLPILSIIAYILGFFSEDQELDFEDSENVGIKSMAHKSIPKIGDNKFGENIGESYFKQISNKKVKSISGYFGINTKPKTDDNKEEDDTDDGDQYYEQVMKNKKVKSVSQYTGFNK